MKVLAIMGSPRKGDSYGVTKQVEAEMQNIGPVEFEYLFLKDVNLEQCRGCFNCISRGKEFCPLKDDRQLIEEKMQAADGVIFASPGYVMNVSALMKNFIDRFAYVFHRPRFFRQKVLLISTGGPGTVRMALKYLIEFKYAGFNIIHKLGVSVMPWSPGQALREKTAKDVNLAARKFYASLQEKELPVPALGMIISYNFFKTAALGSKEYLSADYNYYKDLKDYYYPVKINLIKRVITALIVKFSFFMMRDLGPEVQEVDCKEGVL